MYSSEKYILICDDNEDIVDILSAYAKKEGFCPVPVYRGDKVFDEFKRFSPSIILLDVMMPGKDGFEICREIRKNSTVPIIMITARGEDFDRIMGLDMGADDYVVKPFSPSEVMARVRAVLRRIEGIEKNKNIIKCAGILIDIEKYIVQIHEQEIPMTRKEVEILWLLASNPSKVFSRDNILDSVWGMDYAGDPRTVDTHIKRIRAKLHGTEGKNEIGADIKTVWGVGYKFELIDEKQR